jgi:hypothetical protein
MQVVVSLGDPIKKKDNPLIKHAKILKRAYRRYKRRQLIQLINIKLQQIENNRLTL